MILLFIFISVFLSSISTKIVNQLLTQKYPKYKSSHFKWMITLSIVINLILQLKLFDKMNVALSFNSIYFCCLLFVFTLFMSIISSCLAIAFVIDVLYYELPNELNFLIGILFMPILLFIYSGKTIATGFIIFILYFVLAFFTNSFGMGDAKLSLALGIGIKLNLLLKFMFLSFLFASLFSLIKILKDKMDLKSEIAFGPFIIISFLLIF